LKKVVEDKPIVIPEPEAGLTVSGKRVTTAVKVLNSSKDEVVGTLNFYRKDIGKTFDITDVIYKVKDINTKYYVKEENYKLSNKLISPIFGDEPLKLSYKDSNFYLTVKDLGMAYVSAYSTSGKKIYIEVNIVENQDSSIYFNYKGTDGSKDIRIALGDDFKAISSLIGKEDFICDRDTYKVYVYDTNAPTVTSPVMYQDQAYLNTLTTAEKNKRSNTGAVIPNLDKSKWNKGDFSNFLMLYVLDEEVVGWWTNQQTGNFVVANNIEYKHSATNVPFESASTDNVRTVYESGDYTEVTVAAMRGTSTLPAGNKCAAGGVDAIPVKMALSAYPASTELKMFWEERLCDAWSNGIRKANTVLNPPIGEFSQYAYGYKYGSKEVAQDWADTPSEQKDISINAHNTMGGRFAHLGSAYIPLGVQERANNAADIWGAESKEGIVGENGNMDTNMFLGERSAKRWYMSNLHARQLDGRNDLAGGKNNKIEAILLVSAFARGTKYNLDGGRVLKGGVRYKIWGQF
ncbi:MAG: hypothetical protein ACRCUS_07320, partial [Anaerovoracaceae bacterium]